MQGEAKADCRESIPLTFSLKVYSLESIKKAAYRLLDRAVVDIAPCGDDVQCKLRFRTPQTTEDARHIADDLVAEILDQDLRQLVAEETTPVRHAILAHVFSRTGLQDNE